MMYDMHLKILIRDSCEKLDRVLLTWAGAEPQIANYIIYIT